MGRRTSSTQDALMPRSGFRTRALGRETWPDFVRVVEKHHGVWGGCWCVTFHLQSAGPHRTAAQNRAEKERLVRADRSHAALVYDGPNVIGWCQFGPPNELPARMSRFAKMGLSRPDWRITCFFVDRDRRREGIARAALAGAVRMIAAQGGGTVDGYPIETGGNPTSGSFLWSGTASMFADAGFRTIGPLSTSKSVMRKVVRGRPARPPGRLPRPVGPVRDGPAGIRTRV